MWGAAGSREGAHVWGEDKGGIALSLLRMLGS